jgi:hypothetical protein
MNIIVDFQSVVPVLATVALAAFVVYLLWELTNYIKFRIEAKP